MTTIALKPDLSLRGVATVHDELRRANLSAGPMTIDASAVALADVAGVQLLVSALATARDAGCALSISHMSQPLAQAISRAGLTLSACGQRFETPGEA